MLKFYVAAILFITLFSKQPSFSSAAADEFSPEESPPDKLSYGNIPSSAYEVPTLLIATT